MSSKSGSTDETDADDYDYYSNYDYNSDMEEEHHIYGVGCGAKLIRYIRKERTKFTVISILVVLPYILAYLSAITYNSHLKKKPYEVQECAELSPSHSKTGAVPVVAQVHQPVIQPVLQPVMQPTMVVVSNNNNNNTKK